MPAFHQPPTLGTVATRATWLRLGSALLFLCAPAFLLATMALRWLHGVTGAPEGLLGWVMLVGMLAGGVLSADLLVMGWRLLTQFRGDLAVREAVMSISLGLSGLPLPGTPVPDTGRPPTAEHTPS